MMPDLLTLAVGALLGALVAGPWATARAERRCAARDAARANLPTLHSPALQQAPLYGLPTVTPDPLTAAERQALARFKARCGGGDE